MGLIFERLKKIIQSNFTRESTNIGNMSFWDEEEQLKKEIDEALKNSTTYNQSSSTNFQNISLAEAYKILGVDSKSSFEEIKIAYKRKIKEYHPDLLQNVGKELQDLAKRKIQEINHAFDLIKKERGM